MRILKPGDPCPCCGNPIKTTDPDDLYTLSVMNDWVVRRGVSVDAPALEDESVRKEY